MAEKCFEIPVGLADVVEINGVQVFKNLVKDVDMHETNRLQISNRWMKNTSRY